MENCYSNLMRDDRKGLLSLILSLIGLKVNPHYNMQSGASFFSLYKASFKTLLDFRDHFVADHQLTGAGEGVPEWDTAVCAAGAPVCTEESLGRGAAVCGPSNRQRFHHSCHGLTRANYAGHQAGKSYL